MSITSIATTTSSSLPRPVVVGPQTPPTAGRGAMTALASWYDYSGSSGNGFASRFLPKGTRVRFCRSGRCVTAIDDDYGPAAWTGRTFDLDKQVFEQLAPLSSGVTTVEWEIVE